MRWLEDQVRHITERHDNLLRENTYMRHMLSEQTQKLNHLLQRENEEMEKERSSTRSRKSPQRSSGASDASSEDDSNDSGIRSPPRGKPSPFSIGFLSQSSKSDAAAAKLSERITSSPTVVKPTTTNAQGKNH